MSGAPRSKVIPAAGIVAVVAIVAAVVFWPREPRPVEPAKVPVPAAPPLAAVREVTGAALGYRILVPEAWTDAPGGDVTGNAQTAPDRAFRDGGQVVLAVRLLPDLFEGLTPEEHPAAYAKHLAEQGAPGNWTAATVMVQGSEWVRATPGEGGPLREKWVFRYEGKVYEFEFASADEAARREDRSREFRGVVESFRIPEPATAPR